MGWGIRKSINLGGGARLNISKSGLGVSVGGKAGRVSVGPRGTRVSTHLGPLRYTTTLGSGNRPASGATSGGDAPTSSVASAPSNSADANAAAFGCLVLIGLAIGLPVIGAALGLVTEMLDDPVGVVALPLLFALVLIVAMAVVPALRKDQRHRRHQHTAHQPAASPAAMPAEQEAVPVDEPLSPVREALRSYSELSRLRPLTARELRTVGELLVVYGDPRQAAAAWRKALILDPRVGVKRKLAALERELADDR